GRSCRHSTKRVREWRRSWRGADVSWSGASGRRRQRRRWARISKRRARRQWARGLLFGGVRQLHRPGALLVGIDLEKAGAIVAARQTVLSPADSELFLTCAHVSLARPLAATVVVDRIDVIVTCNQCAAQQRFARA